MEVEFQILPLAPTDARVSRAICYWGLGWDFSFLTQFLWYFPGYVRVRGQECLICEHHVASSNITGMQVLITSGGNKSYGSNSFLLVISLGKGTLLLSGGVEV